MRLQLIVIGAFLLNSLAQAAPEPRTVYKCVSAKGDIAFQDKPCSPGQRETAITVVDRDPSPSPEYSVSSTDANSQNGNSAPGLVADTSGSALTAQKNATMNTGAGNNRSSSSPGTSGSPGSGGGAPGGASSAPNTGANPGTSPSSADPPPEQRRGV